uniref:aspartate dehydrogenase n=1 Tax=Roseovarius sp. TaxID=1486281 RepID=UPI003567D608
VKAARDGKSQLHLASGAIGALDCLSAARIGTLTTVRYTGRKPPSGWLGSPAEDKLNLMSMSAQPQTHFRGSARDAAILYPKNANVAAAIALAGIGFDATEVELIADPTVSHNIHAINAEGDFGSFEFQISGKALPENPRSSALAAMSAVRTAERAEAAIVM